MSVHLKPMLSSFKTFSRLPSGKFWWGVVLVLVLLVVVVVTGGKQSQLQD